MIRVFPANVLLILCILVFVLLILRCRKKYRNKSILKDVTVELVFVCTHLNCFEFSPATDGCRGDLKLVSCLLILLYIKFNGLSKSSSNRKSHTANISYKKRTNINKIFVLNMATIPAVWPICTCWAKSCHGHGMHSSKSWKKRLE